jgi:hypothetical protein
LETIPRAVTVLVLDGAGNGEYNQQVSSVP